MTSWILSSLISVLPEIQKRVGGIHAPGSFAARLSRFWPSLPRYSVTGIFSGVAPSAGRSIHGFSPQYFDVISLLIGLDALPGCSSDGHWERCRMQRVLKARWSRAGLESGPQVCANLEKRPSAGMGFTRPSTVVGRLAGHRGNPPRPASSFVARGAFVRDCRPHDSHSVRHGPVGAQSDPGATLAH
jgi:hypothetical protein